jgi:hypothetical protein
MPRTDTCTKIHTASDSFFADRITVINKDGVLEEHEASGFRPSATDMSSPSDSAKEPDNHLRHEPLDEPEDDMIRYTDLGTYKYYFKSAGPVPCLIFITGTMVFAFCNSFPGTLLFPHRLVCMLICLAVLWLKWWSEASEVNPNTQTAKWLSVYIALGVIGIVGFVVEARYVTLVPNLSSISGVCLIYLTTSASC